MEIWITFLTVYDTVQYPCQTVDCQPVLRSRHYIASDPAQLLSVPARAVDPHSFYADPDPAVFLNTDPDPDPDPGPA